MARRLVLFQSLVLAVLPSCGESQEPAVADPSGMGGNTFGAGGDSFGGGAPGVGGVVVGSGGAIRGAGGATVAAGGAAAGVGGVIIAVDQDPLGIQGRIVATPGANLQVWSKTLSGSDARAVALFNRGGAPASITVQWSELALPARAAIVRDLWTHTDLGTFDQSYTVNNVPSHGVAMLRMTSVP